MHSYSQIFTFNQRRFKKMFHGVSLFALLGSLSTTDSYAMDDFLRELEGLGAQVVVMGPGGRQALPQPRELSPEEREMQVIGRLLSTTEAEEAAMVGKVRSFVEAHYEDMLRKKFAFMKLESDKDKDAFISDVIDSRYHAEWMKNSTMGSVQGTGKKKGKASSRVVGMRDQFVARLDDTMSSLKMTLDTLRDPGLLDSEKLVVLVSTAHIYFAAHPSSIQMYRAEESYWDMNTIAYRALDELRGDCSAWLSIC